MIDIPVALDEAQRRPAKMVLILARLQIVLKVEEVGFESQPFIKRTMIQK